MTFIPSKMQEWEQEIVQKYDDNCNIKLEKHLVGILSHEMERNGDESQVLSMRARKSVISTNIYHIIYDFLADDIGRKGKLKKHYPRYYAMLHSCADILDLYVDKNGAFHTEHDTTVVRKIGDALTNAIAVFVYAKFLSRELAHHERSIPSGKERMSRLNKVLCDLRRQLIMSDQTIENFVVNLLRNIKDTTYKTQLVDSASVSDVHPDTTHRKSYAYDEKTGKTTFFVDTPEWAEEESVRESFDVFGDRMGDK